MKVIEKLRRINAPPPPEESVALRVAVAVAVMSAEIAVLRQGAGDPLLRVVCLVGVPAGFLLSHLHRRRDAFWLKVGLACGLLVAFAGFLATVTRLQGGSLAEVQIPLAELFLWVQFLHSLDVPARRDLLFSLASSMALIAVAGVLSVSLGFALELTVWGLASLVGLVLAHRSELASLAPLGPRHDEKDLGAPAAVALRAGAVVALVAVLGTAAFLVAPAAGTSRALTFPFRLPRTLAVPVPGGLSNPSLGGDDPARPGNGAGGRNASGYFGFSNQLDTSVRGRPDDSLVMRVRASEPDFWRGQTFDLWDGRTWHMSDERIRPVRGGSPLEIAATTEDDTAARWGAELVQTYYVEAVGPSLIFAAYTPTQLYFPQNAVFQLSDGTLRSGVDLEEGAVYTVISQRPSVTPDLLRESSGAKVPADIVSRYTQLPNVPERVRQLAAEVTADAPTVYDQVRALEAWMGEHTRYSLDVPELPPEADAVDRFLFEDRVGFCEQIGTSLVVMLRSLGVPARLAVGYAPGERNPFTGLFDVKAKDAHAWAEVYFPGLGWQGFDPTAQVPLAGQSEADPAGAGLFAYLARHLPHPPAVVFAVAGVALGIGMLLTAGGLFVSLWLRRRGRTRARSWSAHTLALLEEVGAARGRPRRPSESVQEYAGVLRRSVLPDPRLPDVAAAVEADAFSGQPLDDAARAHAEAVVRALK